MKPCPDTVYRPGWLYTRIHAYAQSACSDCDYSDVPNYLKLIFKIWRYLPVWVWFYDWDSLTSICFTIIAGSSKCLTISFSSESSQPDTFIIPYVATLISIHPTTSYLFRWLVDLYITMRHECAGLLWTAQTSSFSHHTFIDRAKFFLHNAEMQNTAI